VKTPNQPLLKPNAPSEFVSQVNGKDPIMQLRELREYAGLHCGRIKQLITHEADELVLRISTSPTSEKSQYRSLV
jgi:hypothetical protein